MDLRGNGASGKGGQLHSIAQISRSNETFDHVIAEGARDDSRVDLNASSLLARQLYDTNTTTVTIQLGHSIRELRGY